MRLLKKHSPGLEIILQKLISGWTNAKKAKREYEEDKEKNETGEGTSGSIQGQLDENKKIVENLVVRIEKL